MILPAETDIVLEAKQVTKSFPGVKALDRVDFQVYRGQVNAVVGENGAGKSTLMNVLSGVYPQYEGKIFLQGREVSFSSPREAQDQGIAIIHQELNLVPYLSVAENTFLGREFLNRVGLIDYRRMCSQTKGMLDKLDVQIDPKDAVCDLRMGQQQIVEIVKVLSLDARIIIMDEPTSAISEREAEILFDLIRSLTEHGVAVVYITHKLDELFQVADIVTVLRDGKVVGCRPVGQITHDDVVRMMVGRDIQDFFVKAEARTQQEVFSIQGMCLNHPIRPADHLVDHVTFSVKAGEVLGIFGLMGAGRTELLETIFGMHVGQSSGEVLLQGRAVNIRSPSDAIELGIGFVPEDRKQQGLILLMSVRANISLANLKLTERLSFLSGRLEKRLARKYVNRLKIKISSLQQSVENLSGGNQQKVVIAKWLATQPKVLLLDEPTRGIDVNAKNEIYKLISELAQAGLAIVMVSSELPEILAISDRIVVLSEGRKTGDFTAAHATEELIMRAAVGKRH